MLLMINALVAMVAVAAACLVGRAYLPHIPLRKPSTPATYLAWSFVVASGFYMPRIIYWDIIWTMGGGDLAAPLLNIFVNCGVILSATCAMKARLQSIPEDERGRYNLISAARYPRATKMFR